MASPTTDNLRRHKKVMMHGRVQPKQIMLLAALVLILYVIIPQLSVFRSSLHLLARADLGWVGAAATFYLATGLVSVAIYQTLLPGRLPLFRTIVVEYGSSFANRLVPAGVGALGVNYLYFKKQRITTPKAVAVVVANNLLGIVGHGLLLLGIAIFDSRAWYSFTIPFDFNNLFIVIASGALGAAASFLILRHFRISLQGLVTRTLQQLSAYRHMPIRLIVSLGFCMAITMLHALCLWSSSRALQVDMSIPQAVIVLAIGVGVGAIIPSPGGLGGAEAGLLAGLVACHIPAGSAVAVAIVYRLVSYWLGFVVGAVTFFVAEKREYI